MFGELFHQLTPRDSQGPLLEYVHRIGTAATTAPQTSVDAPVMVIPDEKILVITSFTAIATRSVAGNVSRLTYYAKHHNSNFLLGASEAFVGTFPTFSDSLLKGPEQLVEPGAEIIVHADLETAQVGHTVTGYLLGFLIPRGSFLF